MRTVWVEEVIRQLWKWWSRVIRNPQPVPVRAPNDRRIAQDLRSSRVWRCGYLAMAIALLPMVAGLAMVVEASNGTSQKAPAQEAKLDEKVAYEEVTGTVTYVGKRAINVEYAVTKEGSYEMMLPYDANVRVTRVKSLVDFKYGDTVRVKYRQTYRHGEKGDKIVLNTVATEIVLVKSAPAKDALRSGNSSGLTTVE